VSSRVEALEVRVGQRWREMRYTPGRVLEVVEVDHENGQAVCKNTNRERGQKPYVRIALRSFRPTARGWRLVKDAPA
jgi:hypothetical protein